MQLELFCTLPPALTSPPVWENLTEEHRAVVVALLARLMSKAVQNQRRRENDGKR